MIDCDDQTWTSGEPDRDAITVEQISGNDPEGLRRLLRDHGGLIRSRLSKDFGRVLDDAEIDEAMSSMVVSVWHAAARFDAAKGSLRAWATVIARNCALKLLGQRRRSALRSVADLDHFELPYSSFTQTSAEHQLLLVDLHECLEQLPPLQRAVLLADLEAGDTVPANTLAKRFGTTANSIYVSRQKGRQAMRKAMEARGHNFAARSATASRADAAPCIRRPHKEHA